jgi:hypothetical protein
MEIPKLSPPNVLIGVQFRSWIPAKKCGTNGISCMEVEAIRLHFDRVLGDCKVNTP